MAGQEGQPYPRLELGLHVPRKLSVRHGDLIGVRRRRVSRYRNRVDVGFVSRSRR
jgi:hypothetical protein